MTDEEIGQQICDELFNCSIMNAMRLALLIKNKEIRKEFDDLIDFCSNTFEYLYRLR